MAQFKPHFLAPVLLMMMVVAAEAVKTPPGIAKNPSNARCMIKKYKHCYNLVHVCPKFCPDECTVECVSCKPICSGGSHTPPADDNTPTPSLPSYSPPPTPTTPTLPPSASYPAPPTTSSSPSPPTPSTPSPTPPSTTPSAPSTPTPTPSTPSSTPSSPSIPTPSTPPSTTPSSPSPSTPPTTPSSPSVPSTPSPIPSTPIPSSPSWTPTPSGEGAGAARARCRNKNYPQCNNMEHVCPSACPGGCEVDCVTCKPVCKCDRPGAVCQDPRFIGGDGITFYFHGKKDRDFCIVSDSNLHINAHFIGRRNENMKRDFTWVQSIAILFEKHQLFIGALKTATWDNSVDRLALSFDGEPVSLPETEGANWQSTNVSITRVGETNNVVVEVEGKFKITAKVVPITEGESRIHNYGITKEDCFAHLDLGFKFYSLSDAVNGVLGQTYRPDYVTKVNMGAKMPVMGGDRDFETSCLFAADCAVARFSGAFDGEGSMMGLDLPSLSCESGIDGKGVVCKR